MKLRTDDPRPLYEQVKMFIVEKIRSGKWQPDQRIPSENELGPMLGVSRITINRAMRELAQEGRLRKVHGVGTFVARDRPQLALTSIGSIAAEIRQRGQTWSCDVLTLEKISATEPVSLSFGVPSGVKLYRSVILHRGNKIPIQLEERFVREEVAPLYLKQDFRTLTTFDYLREVAEVTEVEQVVTAVLPTPEQRRILNVERNEPCLAIRRRTWCREMVTTASLLTQPASRLEIYGRFSQHLVPLARG